MILANLLNLGAGFVYQAAADAKVTEVPSLADTLTGLFPSNLAASWANNQVMPMIIFAIIVGIAYNAVSKTNEKAKTFKSFIDAGNSIMQKAIGYIIDLTPYAVTSLIARAVGRADIASLLPLLLVLGAAYVLLAVIIFIVEPLLLKTHGLSGAKFLRKISRAGVVAFTSQSSTGTLPVTTAQLKNELGVKEDVADFTASLGTTLGMPGCAGVWPTLTAVFVIHSLGLPYGPLQYILIVVFAVLVSAGTVGVPGTATITATALFSALGLPVEYIVLFSPISSIVDMGRTATNVIGSATATVLTAKETGNLDEEVYNSAPRLKAVKESN
jgi:Na+/H+-dicarboxylate symporter